MLKKALLWMLAFVPVTLSAQPLAPDLLEALRYRYVGPVGNRLIAAAGIPGDPDVYYIGAASGGIFKTTDGAATWTAIFDDAPVSSVGSLAVAPSNASRFEPVSYRRTPAGLTETRVIRGE